MKDIYKVIIHDLFQKLIVFSVFWIPCFFWPNHEPRLMKFICLQTTVTIMLGMSFFFTPKRTIDNFYPALFLLYGFLNLFTHGMSDFVNVGVQFIFIAVVGIYTIANHLHSDDVLTIKKAIILLCLINCVLFITQVMKLNVIFTIGNHERPCGFMTYPVNFAMLCGISMILSFHVKRWEWLCIPMGVCLCLSHEFSVIGGLVLAFLVPFLMAYKRFGVFLAVSLAFLGVIAWLWRHSYGDTSPISTKFDLRMKYLYPVIQNVWARPLDGWGVGMYNRLPDSFFGFQRGNWSEMHCEPLDLLFCMGLAGVAIVTGWIRNVRNMGFLYKQIFIVIGVMSLFHSPFHFADSLYLIIVLIALMEIERHEPTATN